MSRAVKQLFWTLVAAAALAATPLTVAAPAAAESIDFRIVTLQSKKCGAACPQVIAAEGDIDETASDRFLKFIRTNVRDKRVKNVVFINSAGGQVVSALKLGLNMRQFGTAVVVARVVEGSSDDPNGQFVSARCMSACVFVLMGGKKRVVPSHSFVGIHRMFRDEAGPDPSGDRNRKRERLFASGNMVDVVSRYTGSMGISRDLIATAERVSPDDIHIVTPQELARWRLGSPKL